MEPFSPQEFRLLFRGPTIRVITAAWTNSSLPLFERNNKNYLVFVFVLILREFRFHIERYKGSLAHACVLFSLL